MASISAAFSRAARQWFTNLKLTWAAAGGENEKVRALLAAGANVHTEQDHALLCAVRRACSPRLPKPAKDDARLNTIRILLEAGADVHARGNRALRIAASQGRPEVARMLLDAGADIQALNFLETRQLAKAHEREMLARAVTASDTPGAERRSRLWVPDKN